jgi:hypothetical protein
VGEPEAGLRVLAEALAQVEKTRERFWEAEVYRLKGELLQEDEGGGTKDGESPEGCFLKAIEVARQQVSHPERKVGASGNARYVPKRWLSAAYKRY